MITIRMMAGDEVKPALKLARKAFAGIECLFISKPKTGIVALIDNQIVGGVFVNRFRFKTAVLAILILFLLIRPARDRALAGSL